MRDALKREFGLLDLLKKSENRTIVRKKGQFIKKSLYDDHILFLTNLLRECRKVHSNFETGSQESILTSQLGKI
jgi:hypothetical protein